MVVTDERAPENSKPSRLDNLEKASKAISLVAIPLVVAILGYYFQQGLKSREHSKDYVELAIAILTREDPASVDSSIRAWAVDLLNQNSPTKFPDEVSRRLKTGAISLSLFDAITSIGNSSAGGFAVSPDGSVIAVGADIGMVKLFDAISGALNADLRGHEGAVTSVAFSPDGRRLASGSYDGTARVWNLKDRSQELRLVGHDAGVVGVSYSPDGMSIYTRSLDDTIRLWDAASGRMLQTTLISRQ